MTPLADEGITLFSRIFCEALAPLHLTGFTEQRSLESQGRSAFDTELRAARIVVGALGTAMAERNSAFDAEFGIRGQFIIAVRAMHPLLLANNEYRSSDRFYSISNSFRYQADAAEVAEFRQGPVYG